MRSFNSNHQPDTYSSMDEFVTTHETTMCATLLLQSLGMFLLVWVTSRLVP